MSDQFEKKLVSLESIVKNLENGDLTLEEALKSFEEGIKMSRECHSILKDAEKKIEILIKDGNNVIGREEL